jgi:hypothetical protein
MAPLLFLISLRRAAACVDDHRTLSGGRQAICASRRHTSRSGRLVVAAFGLWLVPAIAATEPAAPRIRRVDVSPTIAMPGTDLRVTVRIDPNAAVRNLQVTVDAPSYYARTDRQLDGDEAPATHVFMWHDLPPGEYTIEATLESAEAPTASAKRTMVVLGGPESVPTRDGEP